MAEQSGCDLTQVGTEGVREACLSSVPLQEPRDEGRGQLKQREAMNNSSSFVVYSLIVCQCVCVCVCVCTWCPETTR